MIWIFYIMITFFYESEEERESVQSCNGIIGHNKPVISHVLNLYWLYNNKYNGNDPLIMRKLSSLLNPKIIDTPACKLC